MTTPTPPAPDPAPSTASSSRPAVEPDETDNADHVDRWRPLALGLAVRLARAGLVRDLRWYDAFASTPRHRLVSRVSALAGSPAARLAQVYTDGAAFPDPRALAFTLQLLDRPAGTTRTGRSGRTGRTAAGTAFAGTARAREVVQLGHPDLYVTALLCARWGVENVTIAEPDRRRADRLADFLRLAVGCAPPVTDGRFIGTQHGRFDAALIVDRSRNRTEIGTVHTSLKRLLRPDGRLVRGRCTSTEPGPGLYPRPNLSTATGRDVGGGSGGDVGAEGLVDVFERDSRAPLLSCRRLRPPPWRPTPELTTQQVHLLAFFLAHPAEATAARAAHVADDQGGCRVCGPPHAEPGLGHGELLLCSSRVLADLAVLRTLAPRDHTGPGDLGAAT